MSILNATLSGAIMMTALIIALVFLRYWRNTGDRFFLYFAAAFLLEALHRLLAAVVQMEEDNAPLYYLMRLASYGLILLAILSKNRGAGE